MFIGEEMMVQVKNLQDITPIVVEHVYWLYHYFLGNKHAPQQLV
jgi:hypothetical protein